MFRYHYDELHQADSIKDSVEDLDRLEHRLKSSVRGLQASHSFTASQFVVAVAERTFSPGLTRQWRLHTHELHEPPTVDHQLNFIERQKRSTPDDRIHTLKSDRAPKAKNHLCQPRDLHSSSRTLLSITIR